MSDNYSQNNYSAETSGTDLDDEALREADNRELAIANDDIEIDESAEREAREFPL